MVQVGKVIIAIIPAKIAAGLDIWIIVDSYRPDPLTTHVFPC